MAPKSRRTHSILMPGARWASYAVAGAASGVGFATQSDADIIYALVNQRVDAQTSRTVAFPFTLDGNAANQIQFSHHRSASGSSDFGQARFTIKGAVSAGFAGVSLSGQRYLGKLAFGDNLSGEAFLNFANNAFNGGKLASNSGEGNSQWKSGGTGYIGFKFNAGAGLQYGWARITVDGTNGNAFTVLDFAYAGVGEAISVGQAVIPEPGTLALLAVGGAGLLAWRRRRANAALPVA